MLGRRSVGHRGDGSGGRWPRRARRTLRSRCSDHDPAGRRLARSGSSPLGVAYELFACDPALADTAAFCAAYGFAPEDSANTIVVIGKSDPPRYAACVMLAPNRLDVNRAVRDRLGTRKASFAPAEETAAITGMEIGGVTVFGLPRDLPIWVDARVMDARADRARRRVAVVEGRLDARRSCRRCPASRSSRASPPSRRRGRRLVTADVDGSCRPARSEPVPPAEPISPIAAGRGPDRRPTRDRPDAAPPPRPTGPIQYKGDDLEPERGPGLGCFRFQVIVLVVFIVLTPLTVVWNWPPG